MTSEIKGRLHVHADRVIPRLGSIYESVVAALAEYIANAKDALMLVETEHKRRIYVLLEPGKVSVIDNAYGMVPGLLSEDEEMLNLYWEEIQKKGSVEYDPRELVSPVSRASLQWMLEHIGLSGKIPGETEGVSGLWGIGATAYLQLAHKATYFTKPEKSLARQFWGNNHPFSQVPPTFMVMLPTREQLRVGDLSYTVTQSEKLLTDPYGRPLTSGTRVEITDLKQGVEHALWPGKLKTYLSDRFGYDIKTHGIELVIVDKVTDEAKQKGSIEIMVEPPSYRGYGLPLLPLNIQVWGQRYDLDYTLYFDPKGTNLRPQLLRLDEVACALTDLPRLNVDPFNSGKVSGYIRFPYIPEHEEEIWSATKGKPHDSAATTRFQEQVLRLVDPINTFIAEFEDRSKEEQLRNYSADASSALADALQNVPFFEGFLVGKTSKQPKPTKRKTVPLRIGIDVKVINEHSRGIEGIVVNLMQGKRLISAKETGIAGGVKFLPIPGRYSLELSDLASGWMIVEQPESPFNITPERPGISVTFRIFTNSPKPEAKLKNPEPQVWLHPLGDPDVLWEERLAGGVIDINSEAEPLKAARADEDQLNAVVAFLSSQAVLEYTVGEQKLSRPELKAHMNAAAFLCTDMLANLHQRRSERRRQETTKERRKRR